MKGQAAATKNFTNKGGRSKNITHNNKRGRNFSNKEEPQLGEIHTLSNK
jgi:hypothetical protein